MGRGTGRWAGRAALAAAMVILTAPTSAAAVTWGPRFGIPRAYSWNYGNALDLSGTPGEPSFRLIDVFISDAKRPQAAFATSSHDGKDWSKPRRLSGSDVNAENATVAAAGKRVIAGWMTGFSPYDPIRAPRRVQVAISSDRGASWASPKSLSPRGVAVDYPVVAAQTTTFGTNDLYAVWIDAETGKVMFRERVGASAWSEPIAIGRTTRTVSTGYSGFANVAASGDLITVAWIADANGLVKARAIDLSASGSATAASDRSEWGPSTAMDLPVSLRQHGYPVVAASPLVPGVATIAWNTAQSQVFATVTGETIGPGAATIFDDGAAGAFTYTGGYATVVEPAPGGFVAMWAACRDTALIHDCNVRRSDARVDLLSSTSQDGTSFTSPTLVAGAGTPTRRINDAPSVVATDGHVYMQYDGSTSNRSAYDVFARVGTGTP
jgi:hypothetical protein